MCMVNMNSVQSYRARWLKASGVLYKRPCALLLGIEDEYPLFGKLEEVFVLDYNRIAYLIQVMTTEMFYLISMPTVFK